MFSDFVGGSPKVCLQEYIVHHQSSLPVIHQALRAFIETLLVDFSSKDLVQTYFAKRSERDGSMKQDLLPLLVFTAVSGRKYEEALPLAAAWALHLEAAHLVDGAQDTGEIAQVHQSVRLMGVANVALAHLETDGSTFQDLLDAMGRITVLGINAQKDELERGRSWTRSEYFRSIAGKSAAIIATGVWLGGRLATDEARLLTSLKEFGLALGMVIQLSDDYLDLPEDLINGTYTLAVLDGLAQTSHPSYPTLKALLALPQKAQAEAEKIIELLEAMGVLAACQRLIRAYQIQAAAAFTLFPALESYFENYVAVQS